MIDNRVIGMKKERNRIIEEVRVRVIENVKFRTKIKSIDEKYRKNTMVRSRSAIEEYTIAKQTVRKIIIQGAKRAKGD